MTPTRLEEERFRRGIYVAGAAGGATDVGLVRATNEDAWAVDEEGRFLAVADGLGGLPGGEVASLAAVARAVAVLYRGPAAQGARELAVEHMLREAMHAANEAVLEAAATDPALRGMSTALALAWIEQDELTLAHCGDVRCYLLSSARVRHATIDHSLAGDDVRAGLISRDQARHHPRRNVITRALGQPGDPGVEIEGVGLQGGDTVLLCTDGVYEHMDEQTLVALATSTRTMEQRLGALLDEARLVGAPDNMTAVLYDHFGDADGA